MKQNDMTTEKLIEILKRRLNRFNEQRNELENEHKGNELKYTYWGGYKLGYLKGNICEIENTLDELELILNNTTNFKT